ncbi:hypothetical protein FRC09_000599 [Ceratobasidium sp. 395]|nr:hypothetical protein FRC09_000599 [Ceratobasidium sp. 395]
MSPLKSGLKILGEVVPLPGVANLAQAFDSGNSNIEQQEAAILKHVEDLKGSLCGLNTIDRTRQQELKDQLDRLVNDYKSSHTTTNRISRLAKVQATLEALEVLREQLNASVQTYAVDSIGSHSESLENLGDEIQSVEARVSKNETQISSVFDMLKSLKGLLAQAAERITNLTGPTFPQPYHHSPEAAEDMAYC